MPRIAADPRAGPAGVCRIGPDELEQMRAGFGFPYASEDFDRMPAEFPMDALVISTPQRLRAQQALAAIERGLHVMVEKRHHQINRSSVRSRTTPAMVR